MQKFVMKLFIRDSRDPFQHVSLYFPKTILQLGHLCFTFWRLSTQKGTQKQGQSMVKQRMRLRLQAIMLGLVLVLVVMSIWQLGHTSRAGLGPSSGIGTWTTCTMVLTGSPPVVVGSTNPPTGPFLRVSS